MSGADAHGDKEHMAVHHQVWDNIINEGLMPENIPADNSSPCEDAEMQDFIGEEKEQHLNQNCEDSPPMPEGTANESPGDNKLGDSSKDVENDDSLISSDSPQVINETTGMIEISKDKSDDVRNDSDAFLARKEEEGYVPSEVREEKEAAKSRIISDDIPREVQEEEKSNIISDHVPSHVCDDDDDEEEKNDNVSALEEEEKSVEAYGDIISQVNTSETEKEGESREENGKLIEENEKLREMMEKLIKSGQEQLNTISNLSCRINDLENKLSKKKKKKKKKMAVKMARCGGRKQGLVKATDG